MEKYVLTVERKWGHETVFITQGFNYGVPLKPMVTFNRDVADLSHAMMAEKFVDWDAADSFLMIDDEDVT